MPAPGTLFLLRHGRSVLNAVCTSTLTRTRAGTVSETFDTLTAASEGGFGAMVSHRSGETDDTFVADLGEPTSATPIPNRSAHE